MERGPRPLYWKPRHPTRVMRERAFAKAQLEREAALRGPAPRRRSLRQLLRGFLARAARRGRR